MNIDIYRVTNYFDIKNLKIGNVLQFDRFTSWTDKFKVVKDMKNDSESNIIFQIKICDYSAIDLRRINFVQREVLVSPIRLFISDVENDVYVLSMIPK